LMPSSPAWAAPQGVWAKRLPTTFLDCCLLAVTAEYSGSTLACAEPCSPANARPHPPANARPCLPASSGAASALDTPGTSSQGHPAVVKAAASLLTRLNTAGQPPFKRTTRLPCKQTPALHGCGRDEAPAVACGFQSWALGCWFHALLYRTHQPSGCVFLLG
jgi:hypothetical protein